MKDDVREIRSVKEPVSGIIDIGTPVSEFLKSNLPTGREYTEEEKMMFMRKKKIARIVINIRAESGNAKTTEYDKIFNLHIIEEKHSDNVKVMEMRTDEIKKYLEELVSSWEREI